MGDDFKWIDVGTTVIPRNLTERGIGSFLSCMDRGNYKLRWVVHLDHVPGMEQNRDENLQQITELAKQFDDAVIMESTENQGFGRAVHKVLSCLERDSLWIEDDWEWTKPFRLVDVDSNTKDKFCFIQPNCPIGLTGPSFWKFHVIKYLLDHWPTPATEGTFSTALSPSGYRTNATRGAVPRRPLRDIGREAMANMGFNRTLQGINISRYRTKPHNRH
jgi:hypothetical protein